MSLRPPPPTARPSDADPRSPDAQRRALYHGWHASDVSRMTDHEVAALVDAYHSPASVAAAAQLLPLATRQAPAAAPPPPASPAAREVAAPPPAAPEPMIDVAAMVAVLQQAARDGTPFCEECAREAEAAEADA